MSTSPRSPKDRPTAVDFATKNVWGDPLSEDERNECVETLKELVEAFGAPAILRAVAELGLGIGQDATPEAQRAMVNAAVAQALRAYSVLILESDRKDLTVQLVGKLVQLEMATGKRLSMRQLGRANGISKQAVSNRLKMYAARLCLQRPDSTDTTRQAHRLMNRRNYGGPKKG